MNNKTALIQLKGVTKQFGDRVVLDEIDFSVKKGELVTIMGESGAGKTTLLNILGFLETATSGEYLFDGEPVTKQKEELLRNRNIGYVFQSYNLIPKMTVYENVLLPIMYSSHSESAKRRFAERIPELLEKYGVSHICNSFVDYISGGEKQRVCLARAVVCEARVIICDEPTGNLDRENARVVLKELQEMHRDGRTVIVVTHDETVQRIADRRFILRGGKLLENEESNTTVN